MTPYISVVIPTYNRLPMLLRVLEAPAQQENAPDFEVIVIDDGSKDETATTIRLRQAVQTDPFPFHFEKQSNSGPGNARNRRVTLASGRNVIFIGDYTVPEKTFLAEHARIHRANNDDPLVACLGYTGWPSDDRVTAFMDYINDYGLQFGYK